MPRKNKTESNIFDIYKLSVEMSDKISARRITANSFFLTLNSGIILLNDKINIYIVVFLGISAAVTWWLLLKSYRELNTAKFEVIQQIEKKLPVQPFKDEWEILKKDPIEGWKKRYAELGQIERIMPILFGCFYVFLMLQKINFPAILKFVCHI